MTARVQRASVSRRIADVIPRKSGEPIFRRAWEKRIFAIGVTLCERGLVNFDDLRWRVAAAINTWEMANAGSGAEFDYFGCWLGAFERLLLERGLVSKEELSGHQADAPQR